MCGIVGYVGKRNAQNVLLDGLEKLEYRGYDSTGVALALDGGIRVVKSKGRLAELRKKLELQALAESGCGIGHTRWATHGEPSDVNSHPHSTPRVSIVHNGIIENYGILKERLIAKGYTFESETDTEVLVKLIDSCYEGEPLQAIHEALSMVRGSYALAVLFRDFPDTVFAVKRESPLIVGWGEGENFVASDIPALLKYTRRYSVLEEGDLAVVTRECIRFYNEFAEPVEREILTTSSPPLSRQRSAPAWRTACPTCASRSCRMKSCGTSAPSIWWPAARPCTRAWWARRPSRRWPASPPKWTSPASSVTATPS